MALVVRDNLFYVLGISLTAGKAEVERQASNLTSTLEMGFRDAATYATPMGPQPRTVNKVAAALAQWQAPQQRIMAAVWGAPDDTDLLSHAVWSLIHLESRHNLTTSHIQAVSAAWEEALADDEVAEYLHRQCQSHGVAGYVLQPELHEQARDWLLSIVAAHGLPFGYWSDDPGMLGEVARALAETRWEAFEALCSRASRPPAPAEVAGIQRAYEQLGVEGGDRLQQRCWDSLYTALQYAGTWRRGSVMAWLAPYGQRFANPAVAEHLAATRRHGRRMQLLAAAFALLATAGLLTGLTWAWRHHSSSPPARPALLATPQPHTSLHETVVAKATLKSHATAVMRTPGGARIAVLKGGSVVEVLQIRKDFLRIRHGAGTGWIARHGVAKLRKLR